MHLKSTFKHIGLGVLFSGAAFGVSSAFAVATKAPIVLAGVISAVTVAASYAFSLLVQWIGKKYHWTPSQIEFVSIAVSATISVISIVASVALNCLSPWGLALFSAVTLLNTAIQIGQGIALKQDERSYIGV